MDEKAENVHPFVIANFGFQSAKGVDRWANVPHTVKNGLPVLAAAKYKCRITVNVARPS